MNKSKPRGSKAAERPDYLGLALAIIVAAAIAALLVFVPPVYSVRKMALAQIVRETVPIAHEARLSNSVEMRETDQTQRSVPDNNNMPLDVGFDRLAGFQFELTEQMLKDTGNPLDDSRQITDQIPHGVRELSEKEVKIRGFMLPLNIDQGKATEFLLLKNQGMCCYGNVPKMNEWVTVRMPVGGIKPVMDKLVNVTGVLHVGEMRDEGLLTAIYRLDADKLEVDPRQ